MSKGNLLWAIDESSGSFSPLPAGPLLIPGLVILGLLRLFGGSGAKVVPPHRLVPPRILKSAQYRRDCARHRYFMDKLDRFGDLDSIEWIELEALRHPAWNGGRPWFYH